LLIYPLFNKICEKYYYDPWDRRRNPNDWSYNNIPQPTLTDRGFTGHEHLDQFGLINMNGRMYDPVLGRFLSPDPIIQSPDFTQSFNSYSYCINNPLKYNDPSGYLFSEDSFTRAMQESYLRQHGYSQVDIWMDESNPAYDNYFNSGYGSGSYFYELTEQRIEQREDHRKRNKKNGYWVKEQVPAIGPYVYYDTNGDKKTDLIYTPNVQIVYRFVYYPEVEPIDLADEDYKTSFTIHNKFMIPFLGVTQTSFVIETTMGDGAVHMKSVNNSESYRIHVTTFGPWVFETPLTQGGKSYATISLGSIYLSFGFSAEVSSIGIGYSKDNFSSGYESEIPTAFLMFLLAPVKVGVPQPGPIPVPVYY
jgi:RHS repeat-associated protein